ncbi:MAG: transglycosylase domain-containing protein, partial [Bdellovibrionota bacterium]|nr:transglycosylase domain-containing protein [Bdellovibrionota bacterium]
MLNVFKKLVILSIVGCIVGVMSVGGVLIYFSMSLPKISTLADYKPAINSRILSKDGVVLTEIGKENRDVVEIKDVPKRIIDAFLSAEDSGFYEHQGVDYLGVARAFLANIKAGKVVQGGSTITQQVAKSLLLSRERSITRKIKDFL